MIEFHAALLKIHYPTRCRHTLKKPTNKQQTPNVYGITISQSKNVQSAGRPQNVFNEDVVRMTAGFFSLHSVHSLPESSHSYAMPVLGSLQSGCTNQWSRNASFPPSPETNADSSVQTHSSCPSSEFTDC